MLTIGNKYWFIPDEKGELSGDWTEEVKVGQLLSHDHYGVSFISQGEIFCTSVNDVFSKAADADNEFYYRRRRVEKKNASAQKS